jgi:DNA-binding FadR family transcriptional regulator
MSSFGSLRAAQVTPLGRRAPQRLAYELMSRIKAGVFCRGDWLPTEQELLSEFGVSRTALREALIILECLGLIVSHHGSGSQVIGATPRSGLGGTSSVDLVALLEACRAFEIQAASLAAGLDAAVGSLPAPPTLGTPRPRDNAAIAASIENLWDLTAARPGLRGPFNAALAPSSRSIRMQQARVVEALTQRSPSATRQAVGALFDAYLAAVSDFEAHERLSRDQSRGRAPPPSLEPAVGRRRRSPGRVEILALSAAEPPRPR